MKAIKGNSKLALLNMTKRTILLLQSVFTMFFHMQSRPVAHDRPRDNLFALRPCNTTSSLPSSTPVFYSDTAATSRDSSSGGGTTG
jgi:hypothetical protein